MKFQQIRGATAIITFGGKRFLIDPFFADKGSTPPIPSPHNATPNPLVELPVPIEQLVSVDAVIVTHMHHFDHFDETACNAIPKGKSMFTQSAGEAEDMRKLGFKDVTALADNGTPFGEVTLFRTDAAHGQGKAADNNYKAFNIPSEASGVVLKHPAEKTLYIAGDTLWYVGVEDAICKHQPDVIVLNAALAAFADETPILMGTDGVYAVAKVAPAATVITSHLDAVNHARIGRTEMRKFVEENKLAGRVYIPEDGETLSL